MAGGAVAGVVIAFIASSSGGEKFLAAVSQEHNLVQLLSENGYFILGTLFFATMAGILYKVATKK